MIRPATIWDSAIPPEAIRKEHPLIASLKEAWTIYRDCYNSGGGFKSGSYLSPFPGEVDYKLFDKLGERRKLAAHEVPGDYRKFIDTYVGYLTQERPVISVKSGETNLLDDDDGWKYVINNADGNGSSIYDVIADHITDSMTMGTCLSVIDQPVLEIPVETLGDRLRQKAWPYLQLIGIEHLVDWEMSEGGVFLWAKLGENWDRNLQKFTSYKIWTPQKAILFEIDGTVYTRTEKPHPCGEVPVVIFNSQRNEIDPCHSDPPLKSIAHLDIAEYNRVSELTEVLRNCAYPRYYGPPIEDKGSGGTSGVLNYIQCQPGDIPPGVLNADTGAPASIQSAIESIRAKKLELSGLPESSAQPVTESGVAKSYRFRQLERRLITMGKLYERPIKKALQLLAAWIYNQPVDQNGPLEFKCIFPDSYDVFSVKDDLDLLMSLSTLPNTPPTLEKVIQKRLTQKLLPQDSDDTYSIIESEIDNAMAINTVTAPVVDLLKRTTRTA